MDKTLRGWMKSAAARVAALETRPVEKRAFAPGAMFDPAQQQAQGGMPPGGDPAMMQGGGQPPMDPAMMQGGGQPPMDPAAAGGGQDPVAALMGAIDQINQKVDAMAQGGAAGAGAPGMGAPKPPKIDVPATLQQILERLDTQNKMLAALCTSNGVQFEAKDLLPPEIGGEPGMQPVMEQPQMGMQQPAGQQKSSAFQQLKAAHQLLVALGAV
jgi:hypothetical protein